MENILPPNTETSQRSTCMYVYMYIVLDSHDLGSANRPWWQKVSDD